MNISLGVEEDGQLKSLEGGSGQLYNHKDRFSKNFNPVNGKSVIDIPITGKGKLDLTYISIENDARTMKCDYYLGDQKIGSDRTACDYTASYTEPAYEVGPTQHGTVAGL
jgi:hypothetical protein